jgi:hypothetical protein
VINAVRSNDASRLARVDQATDHCPDGLSRSCESLALDSQKNRFWRAPIGFGSVAHKIFFVAKNADSEFAPFIFEPRRRAATSLIEFISQLT